MIKSIRKTILVALLLSATFVSAQNKSAGINLSLWNNLSTQPVQLDQTSYLNLGLASKMNKLHGVGVNLFSSKTIQGAKGLQISGFFNTNEYHSGGIQLSGFTNINGRNFTGINATGLFHITESTLTGIGIGGLGNIVGVEQKGVLIGGLTNLIGNDAKGIQVGGLATITGENSTGIALAGMLNITGTQAKGIQLAGLSNITGNTHKGVQIAGLANVAGDKLIGVQIAPLNFAKSGSGLQIGLVNYRKEPLKGLQLGLVNANPETKVEYMLFGGNATKTNFGVRFRNNLFYTIVGLGTHYLDFSDKFSAAAFYRAGLAYSPCKKILLSSDLGYQHIETFSNKDKEKDIPKRLFVLQARVNMEYQLHKNLSAFISTGYGKSRHYNKSQTFDNGWLIEGGVVLYKGR